MSRKKKKISSVKGRSTRKAMPSRGSLFNVDGELGKAIQYHQSGHVKKAESIYKKILKINPNHPVCLNLLGIIAGEAGNTEMAVRWFSKAVENDPSNPICHSNLGNALKDQGRLSEAISCCQKALELKPDLAEAHNNMGIALEGQGKSEEAMASYEKALELRPDYAEAYYNMGSVFQTQGRLSEAISCCQKAVELKPDYAEAYYNMGSVLQLQGRLKEAISYCQKALELQPGCAEAYYNMGAAFQEWGRPSEAISCYQKSLRSDPDMTLALGQLIDQLRQTCAWGDMENLTAELDRFTEEALTRGARAPETPFLSLTRCTSLPHNLTVAESWSSDIIRAMSSQNVPFSFDHGKARERRIIVGYLSSDFYNHATAHLMLSLFGLHDRDEFEVFCYSYGIDDGSYYRERIRQDCDKFIDIRDLSHAQAAKRIYEDHVDILVDLKGFTTGNRLSICAFRPAPIQVTYLGFPGTTGANFFDYVITDRIVTPQDHAKYYTEHFAYMPHCYQVNDNAQAIATKDQQKVDVGLPEGSLVFCSFNQGYKIEPVMFDVWMKVLRQLPESVLWLQGGSETADNNLRREAEARGVKAERLIFAEKLPKDEHLARLRLSDLALDTRIVNGHTTSSDALWAGVPVVTLQGSHFASRVSSSVLTAIGLSELITHSLEEYEALAVRLAINGDELGAIREKLARNRLKKPLFDTSRFVRNLEKAYAEMWTTYQAGQEARHIEVSE